MDSESYEIVTEPQEWAFTRAVTKLVLKFTVFLFP